MHFKELSKITPARTCSELMKYGIEENGTYYIDPDGELRGHQPIKARCDFQNGITEIGTFQEKTLETCEYIGCARFGTTYDAPEEQIQAIIDQSESCEQDIEFTCLSTPLQFESEQYGWWLDKRGKFHLIEQVQDDSSVRSTLVSQTFMTKSLVLAMLCATLW